MRPDRPGFRGHALTLGACVAVALAWCVLILSESGALPGQGDGYVVHATVPTSIQLADGARVTIAGVEVGEVRAVERTDDGRGTRVTMRLTDERVTPIPADSRMQVRTRSQVGENFVALAVSRSTRMLPSGGTLAVSQSDEQVAVDELLSTLDGPTKDRARKMFQGLGGALRGREDQLNRTLAGTEATVRAGAGLVAVVHRRRRAVAELVDRLGRIMTAVGERGGAIDAIADRGTTALDALGDNDAALSATLRELPATLRRVGSTSTELDRTARATVPLVDDLTTVAGASRPVVDQLGPASDEALALLRTVSGAAPAVRAMLDAAGDAAGPLSKALPSLRTTFCQLNPILRYARPYQEDLLTNIVGLGSASNSYDATGHLVRMAPTVSENSLAGAPAEVNAAVDTLVQSGLLSKSKTVRWDPYMRPGIVGTTKAEPGQATGPEDVPRTGYRYPRVKADC